MAAASTKMNKQLSTQGGKAAAPMEGKKTERASAEAKMPRSGSASTEGTNKKKAVTHSLVLRSIIGGAIEETLDVVQMGGTLGEAIGRLKTWKGAKWTMICIEGPLNPKAFGLGKCAMTRVFWATPTARVLGFDLDRMLPPEGVYGIFVTNENRGEYYVDMKWDQLMDKPQCHYTGPEPCPHCGESP